MNNNYKIGDKVQITVKKFTPIGVVATIDQDTEGLIFNSDIFRQLSAGERTTAFIKNIREDGKIDLTLQKGGYRNFIDPITSKILEKLDKANGFLPFNDKSTPKQIIDNFGFSKTQFKQAIGKLYKERKIKISPKGIELVN